MNVGQEELRADESNQHICVAEIRYARSVIRKMHPLRNLPLSLCLDVFPSIP